MQQTKTMGGTWDISIRAILHPCASRHKWVDVY